MAKKHYQQMSNVERQNVHARIRKLKPKFDQQHYLDRATQRSISQQEVRDALNVGDVIEVHNEGKLPDGSTDVRALVRDDEGICVVISLMTGKVITVYWNSPHDKHDTLDWNPYRWQVDLSRVMHQLPAAA